MRGGAPQVEQLYKEQKYEEVIRELSGRLHCKPVAFPDWCRDMNWLLEAAIQTNDFKVATACHRCRIDHCLTAGEDGKSKEQAVRELLKVSLPKDWSDSVALRSSAKLRKSSPQHAGLVMEVCMMLVTLRKCAELSDLHVKAVLDKSFTADLLRSLSTIMDTLECKENRRCGIHLALLAVGETVI